MKMALRRKFKQCRQPRCSVQAIADARVKFGRPGVSGRTRKTTGDDGGAVCHLPITSQKRNGSRWEY